MDGKSDLLKEAIADAKAVKETALANAKIALEEAFAPRIHNMLSTKLSEDLYEDEMEDEKKAAPVDEVSIEEAPVDEHDVMYEPEAEGGEMDAAPEMDAEMDMEMPAEEPAMEDMEMEGMYMKDADEDPNDAASVEEDLELEAIIRELEEDLNEEELTEEELTEEELTEDELTEDGHNPKAADSKDSKGNDLMSEPKEIKNEEFNIDEIIEGILAEDDLTEEEVVAEGEHGEEDDEPKKKMDELSEELTEAYDTIESLRDTINEVNLLNAKLLYTNKLFRNFELSENQKMKVIENFDRAGNTREVKLVFSTLAENFTVPVKKRKVVKEGTASKPVESTAPSTKTIINEGNELANRWKKLAGLLG
jgi:hypothetical protein